MLKPLKREATEDGYRIVFWCVPGELFWTL